ncbi:MAG: sugar ABC transporter substrate-binding protein [Verrucomicrobia bacterium]|nr:MAG: sugar ABC transporter substrate-binding protein [Verrucomicrobiota bacterium]
MKPIFLLSLLLSFFVSILTAGPAKKLTIAVIPKGTSHEFWKSIHAGAIKAERESEAEGREINLIWKGPLREDDREQQVQVVENFIGRRIDGMVLAPLDSQALAGPVETAHRAGIPVVIIDSGLNTNKIISYIATDNYKGGQLAADRLAELLGSKGKALMLRCQVGSASTEEREAGFLNQLRGRHPGIEIVSSDQHGGATRDTAYRASQNLLNRFGRDLDGIFTPNESTSVGMLLAMRDAGLANGRVRFVGFDSGKQLVGALKTNDLEGLIVQNPFMMGYLGVKTLIDHIDGKTVDPWVDTGVLTVTPDNFEDPEIAKLLNPPLEKYLN